MLSTHEAPDSITSSKTENLPLGISVERILLLGNSLVYLHHGDPRAVLTRPTI
jgi:hypothetical protein